MIQARKLRLLAMLLTLNACAPERADDADATTARPDPDVKETPTIALAIERLTPHDQRTASVSLTLDPLFADAEVRLSFVAGDGVRHEGGPAVWVGRLGERTTIDFTFTVEDDARHTVTFLAELVEGGDVTERYATSFDIDAGEPSALTEESRVVTDADGRKLRIYEGVTR